MTRTIFAAACALALSTSFALAQPSQPQGGASGSPTSNTATSAGATNSSTAGPGGNTTGASSGGGMGPNGSPDGVAKSTSAPTTTSPQGGTGPAGQNTK